MTKYYLFLSHGGIESPLAPIIYKLPILKKVKIFSWLCYNDKIMIAKNLRKCNSLAPRSCPNYGEADETTNHLFLSCPFIILVWQDQLSLFSLPPLPHQALELWTTWRLKIKDRDKRMTWDCWFSIISWLT